MERNEEINDGLSDGQRELCANLLAPTWTTDDAMTMEEAANEITYLAKQLKGFNLDKHEAQTLIHEAACECMAPEQMDKYEALFVGADDLSFRFLRCVLKRLGHL